jgi:hypothetical protein
LPLVLDDDGSGSGFIEKSTETFIRLFAANVCSRLVDPGQA